MGRGFEQTFFQRMHTHGQQEKMKAKMLSSTNHQENATKTTTMRYHLTPTGITIIKKAKEKKKTRNNKHW